MSLPSLLLRFSVLQRLSFHWQLRRDINGFCALVLFVSGARFRLPRSREISAP